MQVASSEAAAQRASFREKSNNTKTGPIGLVTAGRDSCPECPFTRVCYPEGGHLRIHWDKVCSGERGESIGQTIRRIAAQKFYSVWRWGDAGDLPGRGNRISLGWLRRIVAANRRIRGKGFAYTHKPVEDGRPHARWNRDAIVEANKHGFTVNLSAEGWWRADVLADECVAPVVTVLPSTMPPDWKVSHTDAGRRIVRCPAEWTKKLPPQHRVQCSNCGGKDGPLCWRRDRDDIIGFTAHSFAARKIDAIIATMEMFRKTLWRN
jgi:hypothetical protein